MLLSQLKRRVPLIFRRSSISSFGTTNRHFPGQFFTGNNVKTLNFPSGPAISDGSAPTARKFHSNRGDYPVKSADIRGNIDPFAYTPRGRRGKTIEAPLKPLEPLFFSAPRRLFSSQRRRGGDESGVDTSIMILKGSSSTVSPSPSFVSDDADYVKRMIAENGRENGGNPRENPGNEEDFSVVGSSVMVPLYERPLFPGLPGFVSVLEDGVANALYQVWASDIDGLDISEKIREITSAKKSKGDALHGKRGAIGSFTHGHPSSSTADSKNGNSGRSSLGGGFASGIHGNISGHRQHRYSNSNSSGGGSNPLVSPQNETTAQPLFHVALFVKKPTPDPLDAIDNNSKKNNSKKNKNEAHIGNNDYDYKADIAGIPGVNSGRGDGATTADEVFEYGTLAEVYRYHAPPNSNRSVNIDPIENSHDVIDSKEKNGNMDISDSALIGFPDSSGIGSFNGDNGSNSNNIGSGINGGNGKNRGGGSMNGENPPPGFNKPTLVVRSVARIRLIGSESVRNGSSGDFERVSWEIVDDIEDFDDGHGDLPKSLLEIGRGGMNVDDINIADNANFISNSFSDESDDVAAAAAAAAKNQMTESKNKNKNKNSKNKKLSKKDQKKKNNELEKKMADELKRLRENYDLARRLRRSLLELCHRFVKTNRVIKNQLEVVMMRLPGLSFGELADVCASVTLSPVERAMEVLAERDVIERMKLAHAMLSAEISISASMSRMLEQQSKKAAEAQKRYHLTEQLKAIQRELQTVDGSRGDASGENSDPLSSSSSPNSSSNSMGGDYLPAETPIDRLRRIAGRRAASGELPAHALAVIRAEFSKAASMEMSSSEAGITRTYLEWLISLPWERTTTDLYDIPRAQGILDADHYGLKDVKERILEFIAVGSMVGSVSGKIVCLAGPPGVGKTSVGESIARSLGREFYRFSVGGMRDVAEIKGHRRTYVGALPGKLLQALKLVGSSNPVIMIDEIDKVGTGGHNGDPSSALLEVLDPAQNASFLDHYLDVPVDLSKVLFVCTANVLDAIPGPLRDRMEVITLSGYILSEKVAIAKKYLIPRSLEEAGLYERFDAELLENRKREMKEKLMSMTSSSSAIAPNVASGAGNGSDADGKEAKAMKEKIRKAMGKPLVVISDKAIEELAKSYCREAGVRSLQQHIEKIHRKAALKIAKGETKVVSVTAKNLSDFVGKPVFTSDKIYEHGPPVGVVMGLAWTAMGGSTLYIETTAILNPARKDPISIDADVINTSDDDNGSNNGSNNNNNNNSPGGPVPGIKTTGKMGDVMLESTQIAFTFSRHFLRRVDPSNTFLDETGVHMHIPEGAIPKDGPSAGCTMTTALISLATSMRVRSDLAMTGEISLTGKVLPVGGIKEKILAARRSGVTDVIVPDGCRRDVSELEEEVRQGISFHYAREYEDVFRVAFDEKQRKKLGSSSSPDSMNSNKKKKKKRESVAKGKGKAKKSEESKGNKKKKTSNAPIKLVF